MPRVTFVKKARKDNPACKKGESYYWWAMMSGGRYGPKRYSKTMPKPSQLTNSEFLGAFGDIEDEIGSLAADDSLESSVADIAQRIRELGEEQSNKKDNMPDALQEAATGELLQERADKCEEIASELEDIDFSDKPDEKPEDRAGTDEASAESEDESEDDYWQGKLDEVQAVDLTV